MSRRWAIIDLDGSVSDCEWRQQIARDAKAATNHGDRARLWDLFHANCVGDPAHDAECELVRGWSRLGHGVVYLTGRTESHRAATIEWLRTNGMPEAALFMRPVGTHAPTLDYKVRQVKVIRETIMAPDDTIAFFLEDHDGLVAHWRRMGFTVLQPRSNAY